MDYKKIPSDQIEWVKTNWANRNRSEVVNKFKEWGVIGNMCGTCGLMGIVDEFMKYWVREKKI